MTHDEGDDDSSSLPGEPDVPGDAAEQEALEHPPGHPGWLRILSETNSAQRTPLEDGADRVRGIDPTHWSGAARDGYTARRDELAEQWQAVLGVHGGVTDQVDGYNRFLHQLPHLWEDYRNNPDELRRLNALHDATAERLARALEAEAARLDGLAGEPAPREELRPESPDRAPEAVRNHDPDSQQSDVTTTNSGDAPRHEPRPDPIMVVRERLREHELVNELLQAGRRVERFLWRRPTG
ncbi:hypothetical protein [Lentzea sp. NPDC060358]|uniref:hypothetical protein n=1 Tax=Lentzea sp. NPDC060358 TaxID=3347103 RepID=UPI003646B6A4